VTTTKGSNLVIDFVSSLFVSNLSSRAGCLSDGDFYIHTYLKIINTSIVRIQETPSFHFEYNHNFGLIMH
jgi:hypothetical protein